MAELAVFVGLLLRTFWPTLNTFGLQFGITVGLFTPVPYATLDYPDVSNRRYWIRMALFLGLAAAIPEFFAHGRPRGDAAIGVLFAFLSTAGGVWLGLTLGNQVNRWIVALKPVFVLLKRLRIPLTAFAVGYLSIIVVFATFFAAVWRVQGARAFSGLPTDPTLPVFLSSVITSKAANGYHFKTGQR